MSTLPLPVRVAVGLAVTAVEQARKLPEQLSDLPVTAASRAVQAAMRVQQRVTELAIKGDQVCALFQPVEDTAPWARFDEDDAPGSAAANDAARTAVVPGPGAGHGTAAGGSGEVDEADVARALTSPTTTSPTTTSQRPPAADAHTGDATSEDTTVAPSRSTPAVLPEYDELSLAQLRGRLRALSLSGLTELLEYEHAHRDRAAFVTMLSNRISTVRSHMTESQ